VTLVGWDKLRTILNENSVAVKKILFKKYQSLDCELRRPNKVFGSLSLRPPPFFRGGLAGQRIRGQKGGHGRQERQDGGGKKQPVGFPHAGLVILQGHDIAGVHGREQA